MSKWQLNSDQMLFVLVVGLEVMVELKVMAGLVLRMSVVSLSLVRVRLEC